MTTTSLVLHPACRVRAEKFGLLFYDARGPRLLFAETGELIPPEFFQRSEPVDRLMGRLDDTERSRVRRFLSSLSEKGFLREQPIG